MSDILKILVCYHKPYLMPPADDALLPIQVGRALSEQALPMQADNEAHGQPCDNISHKNQSYCELTAVYWAWKNLRTVAPGVQYVGLAHYRRLFAFDRRRLLDDTIARPEEEITGYRFDATSVTDVLKKGRVIAARRKSYPCPLSVQYCGNHISDDYRALKEVIKNDFPAWYDAFLRVMEYSNKLSSYNMFIMPYDDFVDYCEWLFPVLALMEEKVPWQRYNPYQKRVLGFMGERLLNVYLAKRGVPVEFRNVYAYDKQENIRGENALLDLAKYVKRELTAKLFCLGRHTE